MSYCPTYRVLLGISHMTASPRPSRAFSAILSHSERSASMLLAPGRGICPPTGRGASRNGLYPSVWSRWGQTAPVVRASSRRFVVCCRHPGTGSRGLSRRMRSRMLRKSHRGTATSAIWKMTYRAWVTTLAPILISFSRNVVSDQCFTDRGETRDSHLLLRGGGKWEPR